MRRRATVRTLVAGGWCRRRRGRSQRGTERNIPSDVTYNAVAVEKAIASMRAFDSMPAKWREFCAGYGRTARGESLAALLAQCGGDIELAGQQLTYLLPLEEPPRLLRRQLKPIATYDLKAERRLAKPKRKKPKRKRKNR